MEEVVVVRLLFELLILGLDPGELLELSPQQRKLRLWADVFATRLDTSKPPFLNFLFSCIAKESTWLR